MTRDISIGDPARVTVMALNGVIATEKKIPATVCYVDAWKIGVAFSDGTRRMFPRRAPDLEILT